jgi:hypothetical protein
LALAFATRSWRACCGTWSSHADVGADVALGYVGLGLGVSPGEFVDLLLGFVGIDIGGDDMFGRAPTTRNTRRPTKAPTRADRYIRNTGARQSAIGASARRVSAADR